MSLSQKVSSNNNNNTQALAILHLSFQQPLEKSAMRFFKRAMDAKIQAAGLGDLQSGSSKPHYYPLIQYQHQRGCPQILAIGQGLHQLQAVFKQQEVLHLEWKGQTQVFNLETVDLKQCRPQMQQEHLNYEIQDWIALNPANYKAFKKIRDPQAQQAFLENKLKAHLLAFAKGIDWHVEAQIELNIHKIPNVKTVLHRSATVLAFHVQFSCNMLLPDGIGLGKGVSFGFGSIWKT